MEVITIKPMDLLHFNEKVIKDSVKINLRRVCRLCLIEKRNMKNLFEYSIALMVRSCAKVEVYEGDGLPSLICIQCVNQLSRSFSFKELCERSDTTLREFINNEISLGNEVDVSPDPEILERFIDKNNLSEYIEDLSNSNTEGVSDLVVDYTSIAEGFINLENTEIDKINDTALKKYICDVCNKELSSYKTLQQHYMNHNKKKNHSCATCLKTFSEARFLTKHIETQKCQRERNFVCTVCNKSFYDIKYLNIHVSRHLIAKSFSCNQCGEKCSDRSSLRRHILNFHSNVEKHKCQFCSKSFLFPGGLETHIRSHTNERPYLCKVCNAAFTTKTILSNHMKVHGDKPHQCTYCEKRFTYGSNLTVHIRTHTGERPYLCNKCAKGFCTSTELSLHLQKHNGEKRKLRETCSVCQKMFPTSFELKKHYRIHTGEKPYSCEICDMRFTAKSGLYSHARVHSEVRNHQCPDCPKAFKDSSTLRSHVRTHSGEKPYACQVCGHRFAQSSARNTHMKTHALR